MSGKPTAQGTLDKTPFAHLLLYALDRKLTGTLAIWPEQEAVRGRGQDRLFLQDGQVVAVRPIDRHSSSIEAVIGLFARLGGPYGFYADQNLLGSSDEVLYGAVDTFCALSRGLRTYARNDIIDGVLMRLAGKTLRVQETLPIERLELPAAQLKLVQRLQKSRASLDELLRDGNVPPQELRTLLYLLTLIRAVEVEDDRPASAGLTVDTIPPAPKPDSIPTEAVPVVVKRTTPAPAPLKHPTTPAPAPIKHATTRPAAAQPAAPTKPNPFGSGNTGLTALIPAPPAPIGLLQSDSARWYELANLHDKLDELTHYQLLGLSQSATAADISAAYFNLVKKMHPDRLPLALAPLARCAQQLFERLTEAQDTLSNAQTRAEYDKAVASGGGTRASERTLRNVLESIHDFQKAEVLMKRRDFTQALQHLRSALNKNPDESDYHALHGALLHLMNPTDPAPTDEMLQALDKALKGNPQNERAHYYRGVVLKRLKRDREALHHFRTAANINPRNVDAVRELRLASMRRESKPPPPGLLSKLFKGGKEE